LSRLALSGEADGVYVWADFLRDAEELEGW
jgi:hypothetical protein